MSFRSLTEAVRASWLSRASLDTVANIGKIDYAHSNSFQDTIRNNAGTGLLPLYGSDTSDNVHLQGQVFRGARNMLTFDLATNAQITTQAFWIADDTYIITSISCIFATADGATNTAFIGKSTGTSTPAQAKSLMTGTFNMNATAATVQNATLAGPWNVFNQSNIQVNKGDRLVFVLANAVTSLAGVAITIGMVPGNKSETVEYVMNLNSAIGTTCFFVSDGSYIVTGVQAVWSTAGTDPGTVTGNVTIDPSGTAPGGGTSILTAAFSMKTAANTVVAPALSATAANLRLNAGSQLSFVTSGTLTALAGLVVVVSLTPLQDCIDINWTLKANAQLGVDQTIFIAQTSYELIMASATYSTAAGGALTLVVTRESGTTAAGAGTAMQSGTFNLNTTTNTPQYATMQGIQNNYVLKGDRLSIHFSAGAQALVGLAVTLTLRQR